MADQSPAEIEREACAKLIDERMDDGLFHMHISSRHFSRVFKISTQKRGRTVITEVK